MPFVNVEYTEPSLAVDNEVVHLAFVSRVAVTMTSEVWYNRREGPPSFAWNGPPNFPVKLSDSGMAPGEAKEPDITAWGTYVYEAWSQYSYPPVGAKTYQVYVAYSYDGGDHWVVPITGQSEPLAASFRPTVAADDNYVYVAMSQVAGASKRRISFMVLDRWTQLLCSETLYVDNQLYTDDRPQLVVDHTGGQHVKNIAFQRRSVDAFGNPTGPWEIYGIRSAADQCGGWPSSPVRLSAVMPTEYDSMNPSLAHASHLYLHLMWEDHDQTIPGPWRIHYIRSSDLGVTWGPETTIPTSEPNLLDQSQPSVASCTTCIVGVVWTQEVSGEPDMEIYFQWSETNGDSWQTNPIRISDDTDLSTMPSMAADELRSFSDALFVRLHVAWDSCTSVATCTDGDPDNDLHSVYYKRSDKADETGTSVGIVQTGLHASSGKASVITPTQLAYIFGGEDRFTWPYQYSNQIMQFTRFDQLLDTGHQLLSESGKAWMGAVWWPGNAIYAGRAYLFWGRMEGGYWDQISPCITVYVPNAATPVWCDQSMFALFPRYGTSAIYDGARFIYVFGGSYINDAYALTDIIRIDTLDGSFDPDYPGASATNPCPPTCLPQATIYSAAVWNPDNQRAYIIRGVPFQHGPGIHGSVIEFNPSAGSVTAIAQFPDTVDGKNAPAWKFSATYDQVIHRVVIFGGSHDCQDIEDCVDIFYHSAIFRFNPATSALVQDQCLRLPSDREGTSAVWRDATVSPGGASLVFGGSSGVWWDPPWIGIDEVVQYVG